MNIDIFNWEFVIIFYLWSDGVVINVVGGDGVRRGYDVYNMCCFSICFNCNCYLVLNGNIFVYCGCNGIDIYFVIG